MHRYVILVFTYTYIVSKLIFLIELLANCLLVYVSNIFHFVFQNFAVFNVFNVFNWKNIHSVVFDLMQVPSQREFKWTCIPLILIVWLHQLIQVNTFFSYVLFFSFWYCARLIRFIQHYRIAIQLFAKEK